MTLSAFDENHIFCGIQLRQSDWKLLQMKLRWWTSFLLNQMLKCMLQSVSDIRNQNTYISKRTSNKPNHRNFFRPKCAWPRNWWIFYSIINYYTYQNKNTQTRSPVHSSSSKTMMMFYLTKASISLEFSFIEFSGLYYCLLLRYLCYGCESWTVRDLIVILMNSLLLLLRKRKVMSQSTILENAPKR